MKPKLIKAEKFCLCFSPNTEYRVLMSYALTFPKDFGVQMATSFPLSRNSLVEFDLFQQTFSECAECVSLFRKWMDSL